MFRNLLPPFLSTAGSSVSAENKNKKKRIGTALKEPPDDDGDRKLITLYKKVMVQEKTDKWRKDLVTVTVDSGDNTHNAFLVSPLQVRKHVPQEIHGFITVINQLKSCCNHWIPNVSKISKYCIYNR